MSIGVVPELSRYDFALLLAWLGTALLLLLFTRVVRWPRSLLGNDVPPNMVPLLGGTAVITFIGWMAAQMLFMKLLNVGAPAGEVVTLDSPHRALLAIIGPAAGVAIALTFLMRQNGLLAIGLTPLRWKQAIAEGSVGIAVAVPLVILTSQVMLRLWDMIRFSHADQHELLRVYTQSDAAWVRPAIWLAAVVLAPVFEEILFRGMVQTTFTKISGRAWFGIVAASSLFALIHAAWTAPAIFVLSLLIGVVYARNRNLLSAILMHSAFNAFGLLTSVNPPR